MLLLLACRPDDPLPPPPPAWTDTADPDPTGTGDTGPSALDAPCDGAGEGEGDCSIALADADVVLLGGPFTFVPDLDGDGRDDAWWMVGESGGSYHSTWRTYVVRVYPDPLGSEGGASFDVDSDASHSEPYFGTDSGVTALRWSPDATGDGVPDVWVRLVFESWVLLPGPLGGPVREARREAVAEIEGLADAGDADHDGVGDVLAPDHSVRCEGPFSGPVGASCEPSRGSTFSLSYRQSDADLDGDGVDDVVDVEFQDFEFPTVTVRAGSPQAPWDEPVSRIPLGTPYERELFPPSRAADLDADGAADLAWADPISHPEEVFVHRGPLDPVLAFATAGLVVATPGEVAVGPAGDVEGDGVDELVLWATGNLPWGVHVVHAGGSGTAASAERSYVIADGERVEGAQLADLDGDGRSDVIVRRDDASYVFLGSSLAAR